jgi:hypothetical protein
MSGPIFGGLVTAFTFVVSPVDINLGATITVEEKATCKDLEHVWETCARWRRPYSHEVEAVADSYEAHAGIQNAGDIIKVSNTLPVWLTSSSALTTAIRIRALSCVGGRWQTVHFSTVGVDYRMDGIISKTVQVSPPKPAVQTFH